MDKYSDQISESTSKRTLRALLWRVSDKGAQYGIQIVLQIVLARLLSPDDYGVYAVLAAAIALLGIMIEGGLSSALIQGKDVDEDDYSTVFWFNIALSTVVIVSLFLLAPVFSLFFNMPNLCEPLRVASVSLFFLGYNSLIAAKYMKALDFRAIFLRTLLALLLSGIVGVLLALGGFGVWALVWQQLLYQFVVFVYFVFRSRWHPAFVFRYKRLSELFSFGWKICLSSLLRSGYDSFLDLMLGKCMDSSSLGFYNRGRKFAQVASSVVDDPIKTVLFPAFSTKQEHTKEIIGALRNIVLVYAFIALPVLFTAVFFGEDIIVLLLSEAWRESAVYFQICCISYIAFALSTPSLALFNAIGKSEIPMILEAIRLCLTIIGLFTMTSFGLNNTSLIAAVTAISLFASLLVMIPNYRILDYPLLLQIKDYGKPLICALLCFVMLIFVNSLFELHGKFVFCILAAICYFATYVLLSRAFQIRGIELIKTMVKK